MLKLKKPTACLFYPIARKMGVSVHRLISDSEVHARALLEIERTYPGDALIRMTELWSEAAGWGMEVTFTDKDFPRLGGPLFEDIEDFAAADLPPVVNETTSPLIEAVEKAVGQLNKPLIVGVTGPFTLAGVLLGSEELMFNSMTEADLVHDILRKLSSFLHDYIQTYKQAGAGGVILCEPSVAMISPTMTGEFSNQYIEPIIQQLQDDNFAIIYHNCGAINAHLEVIAELSAEIFHFGSDVDLLRAGKIIATDRTIMGNIDPRLFLPANDPGQKIAEFKAGSAGIENIVMSTGCDLAPNSLLENIDLFFG